MKTKILLLTVGLITAVNLLSQNPGQEYTNKMDSIFQYVNKSRITTGLLSDYGLQMVEPDVFNGVPADSNYVDMDTWKMLYSGMYTSKINNNVSLTLPEMVFTQIDNATHATAMPLTMMHYQYNQLNENAVTLNLLQVVNDQIIEVPNAASPYLTKQLFAVAPKELSFDGPTARFVFKSTLFYKNVTKTVQKLEVNFNNQSGYLIANWDTQVSYTFSTGGIKTIYFRLTYTDGTFYTSQTNIHVTATTTVLRAAQAGITSIYLPATSQHSGGTLEYKLSAYNTTGNIRKPLIVAKGFDPSDKENLDNLLYSTKDFGTINVSPLGFGNLRDKIDFAQYDIVFLKYNNGMDDIWRNAQLFKDAIKKVNNELKVGNAPNVVMGISMGGLVARITLRQLENEGYNHQTCKYISVDSPHKGANVPIGLQAAVRHLQNIELWVLTNKVYALEDSKNIKFAIDLLNSTAAKQMLIYTINQNYTFDNSVHNNFQTNYDQLGFPQQCENVAISNGSNNAGLSFFAGNAIISYQYSYSLSWALGVFSLFTIITNYPQVAWNAIPGSSQVKIEFNVDALKNSVVSRVYKGKVYIRKKILWLIPVNITLEDKTVNSTATMLPIDGAPGGVYSIYDMMGGALPSFLDSTAIKQPKFCFIPTVSSLALSDWNTKLTQNLNNVTTSPFHFIYAQGNNELHTRFNSSASFLYNHVNVCSCSTVNFTNQIVTANQTVTGCYNLNVQNVTVTNNATLTLIASGEISIDNFEIQSGSNIIIQ